MEEPAGPPACDGGLPDYSGPFHADFRYEDLSREALVRLVREYAQAVHILDRSMCAAIGMSHGMEEMERLAIEEWRGASPVYGQRLRRIMGVEGDDVEAIFKVLQLDPGFPHHYLDVRYEVVDERHGYFELAYCGALMDAEPWGDKMVTGHVPPHRGRDIRRHRPGHQPQGPHPPRPPTSPGPVRPGPALPLGAGHRRRQRDPARGRHHHHHQDDHRGHLRVPTHAGRDTPHPRGRRRALSHAQGTSHHGRAGRPAAPPTGPTRLEGHPAAARAPVRPRWSCSWSGPPARRSKRSATPGSPCAPWPGGPAWLRPPPTPTSAPRTTCWPRCCGDAWRRSHPSSRTGSGPVAERLADAVRSMVLFTAESPALVDACTVALLSPNPDVKHLRDRIGAQIHRRLAAALGPGVDPLVVRVLETSFSGSLLTAGMGHMPYDRHPRLPGRRGRAAARSGAGGRRVESGSDDHHPSAGHLQPVRLRDPRGPLPGLCPAAGRGPGLPERGARLLGPVPARGRARRLPQRGRLLQRPRASPSIPAPSAPTPTR